MRHRASLLLTALAVLVVAPGYAAYFQHDRHLQYTEEEGCVACHAADAQSIVPAPAVCEACHEAQFVAGVAVPSPATHGPAWALNHRAAAKGETYRCDACHQQDDCFACHQGGFADEMGALGNAMVNVHRSDFHVTHPLAARTDPQRCSACHESKFCQDCHAEFRREDLASASHRRSFSGLAVSPSGPLHEQFAASQCQTCHPESVLPTHQWASGHGREARKNLATCRACHPDGDTCLTCHSARAGLMINPHPSDWGDLKNRLKNASNGRTCRKCH